MNRDPLADARAQGVRVEIAPLGAWSPALLVAEYDRASRTIRVNSIALQRVRAANGAAAARALLEAAVAHELYHHVVAEGQPPARKTGAFRTRTEQETNAAAYAQETYGIDQRALEVMLGQ